MVKQNKQDVDLFEKFVPNMWPASISLSQSLSEDCLSYSMLPQISWLMGQCARAGCPKVICTSYSIQDGTVTCRAKLDMERISHFKKHGKPKTCFMFFCVPAHGKDTYVSHCHSLLRHWPMPRRLWRTRSRGIVVKFTRLYQHEPLKTWTTLNVISEATVALLEG